MSCAIDNTVIVSYADDFKAIKNIKVDMPTGFRSTAVEVTHGTGSIVLELTSANPYQNSTIFNVYTINGIFRKRIEVLGHVTAFTCITDATDSDYIAYGLSDGAISVCPILSDAAHRVIYTCDSQITALSFLKDAGLLTVGTVEGSVIKCHAFC